MGVAAEDSRSADKGVRLYLDFRSQESKDTKRHKDSQAEATADVAAMHPVAQVTLIFAGVLVMLAGAYIFRERLRKWRVGDR